MASGGPSKGSDTAGTGICQRVAAVRLQVYGRRGRARLAHDLGISPSTYNYYEKDRVPPAPTLARIADLTNARLEWLITGRGDAFPRSAPGASGRGGAAAQGVLDRLRRLLASSPRLDQPVTAFVQMLEEMAGAKVPEAREAEEAGPAGAAGLIPVIGGTAAGVARFWRDYGPGRGGATSIEARAEEVLGRAFTRERRAAHLSSGQGTGRESPAEDADRAAALVQATEPDAAGVVEFIDCPHARSRARDLFGLRVDGDSMSPRYEDGDIVLLSPDAPAVDGRPAVVKLKGQIGATCKLYVPRGDRVHLVPVNDSHAATAHRPSDVDWALAVLWRVALQPAP